MSLTKEFAEMVKEQQQLLPFVHPLICGAEFSPVKQKNRCLREYQFVLQLSKKNGWQQLPQLVGALHNPDTAIILTDPRERIQWVNEGFFRMTGYGLKEAIGQNPRFLQGKETSAESKRHIRQSIDKNTPFTTVIQNYRKSGEAYFCKITVYPLYNKDLQLVNFLAVENETGVQAS